MEFKFPDVGEGIAEGVLVKWLVKEGDAIKTDQHVCEVETDKAVVDIPSPVTGIVQKLHWKQGDTVPVGKVLMTIDEGGSVSTSTTASPPSTQPAPTARPASAQAPAPATAAPPAPSTVSPLSPSSTSAQHGADVTATRSRATPATRKFARESGVDMSSIHGSGPDGRITMDDVKKALSGGVPAKAVSIPAVLSVSPQAQAPLLPPVDISREIIATPSTRRLARQLNIDIRQVRGSGSGGRITDEDVNKFLTPAITQIDAPVTTAPSSPPSPSPSPSPSSENIPVPRAVGPSSQINAPTTVSGNVTRVPLSSTRKAIANHLTLSSRTIAQATHMDSVDITDLAALREKEKVNADKQGVKLTYLPFIVKALVAALKKYPACNSSLDETTKELLLKKEYNIGIAVDTPEGLVVPVIKDADRKSIFQISKEIVDLATRAKERKLKPDEMKGSTCSISNIGSIGGEYFVPIVNYPEVAILGICRIKDAPVVKNGALVIRKMLNIVVSYDHRVLDGADVARFTNEILAHLEDPNLLLLDA